MLTERGHCTWGHTVGVRERWGRCWSWGRTYPLGEDALRFIPRAVLQGADIHRRFGTTPLLKQHPRSGGDGAGAGVSHASDAVWWIEPVVKAVEGDEAVTELARRS